MRKKFFLIIGVLFGLISSAYAEPLNVTYPVDEGGEERIDYELKLLKLALDKSGREYVMQAAAERMNQARAISELTNGGAVTVLWSGTSQEREANMLPVRVPLKRGLLGHRIFIIHKDRQADFSRIETFNDLTNMLAGQGVGWPDVEILSDNGLPVDTAGYEALFKLVDAGRIDYFPRAVHEAITEVEARKSELPNLTVEKDLMVVYPFASFFFVAKGNQELHDALYDGLMKAYEDGSFMALFDSHPRIQAVMEQGNMAQRRKFEIRNPLLTPETAAIPDRFWHGRGGN